MGMPRHWFLGGCACGVALLASMHAQAKNAEGVQKTGRIARLEGAFGALKYPLAVRVGHNRDIYVLDSGNGRMIVLGNDGKVRQSWPIDVSGNTQFEAAADIALDKSGNVYLADAVNHRVQKYSPTGRPLLTVGKQGEITGPLGVAVATDGTIFVSDTRGHGIAVYDAAGKLLRRFGSEGTGKGQVRFPHGIAIDKKGDLYVADFLNDRIAIFSASGRPLGTIGKSGKEPGQFHNPTGVAIDPWGRIWVADSENARVQVLAPDGTHPQVLTGPSTSPEEAFDHPKSISVTPDGEVLVCNTGKHAVDVFRFKRPSP